MESYLQNRYGCMPASSSSDESASSESGDSSESSESSDSSSSESSSSDSSYSENSDESDQSNDPYPSAKIIYYNGATGDKDVTDPQATRFHVLPGQRNYLRIQLEPAECELVSAAWLIPMTAIEDYRSTPDKGEVIELKPEDLTKDTIPFYWVDGGEKVVTVTIRVRLNGVESELTPTATFQVDRKRHP